MPVQTIGSSVTERHVASWSKTAAFLRWVGRSLAAAGAIWVHVPPPDDPAGQGVMLRPPPGHPEQLRPDIPLSAEERDLARRLLNPKEIA
ncbi:hypothetical protein OHB07_38560 (plasmid) [Streptomyces sp. NBC_00111]|uniref:DUF6059 family protein n=1 Tax=unclassified Streptomyces TaxID=2593676 RepID=UPI002E2F0C22|nr:DUF6059 family protein [Streptomyces sp. NBC_01460]